MSQPSAPTADRRQHVRRSSRVPLAIETAGGGAAIPCESLDLSIGGMRLRSSSPIALGPCDIIISGAADDLLVLHGDVVAQQLDASTGDVTARVVFRSVLPSDGDRLLALPDHHAVLAAQTRRRGGAVLAAGIAAALVLAGALVFLRDDPSAVQPAAVTASVPTTEVDAPASPPASVPAAQAASADAPVADLPAEHTPTGTVTADETTPAPAASPPPPASDGTSAPAPRVETADNSVHVSLGSSPEETAVSSSMGPSEGVDPVRIQLHVMPEQDGTTLPVSVTLENRGEETLTFEDGFRAIVTAVRDGVVVATATFHAGDVTEAAPGQVVALDGLFDFGEPGEYDLTVEVEVNG